MTKIENKTQSQLIKDLDAIYSRVIRLEAADKNGIVQCSTCPKRFHWKEIQCGHFKSRGFHAVRFFEKNTAPQCGGCNNKMWGNGRPVEFAIFLEKKYGYGIIQEIEKESRKRPPGRKELIALTEAYKNRLENLSHNIGSGDKSGY